jgi:hypothetical protein
MMTKFIAIGGEPATGKSTLMKRIIDKIEILSEKSFSEQKFFGLPVMANGSGVIIFGVYETGHLYGGTDRFAMNIQPAAENFAKKALQSMNESGFTIIFEGDRLFNEKYLDYLVRLGHILKTFVIECDTAEKERRHRERGDKQNEIWKKGRITKIETIKRHNTFLNDRYHLTVLQNANAESIDWNAQIIMREIDL